jgi:hypothetical protein
MVALTESTVEFSAFDEMLIGGCYIINLRRTSDFGGCGGEFLYERDDSEELIRDPEFMAHFRAGLRDLEAGRSISADDLERELGL